jgi:hypothetical protein
VGDLAVDGDVVAVAVALDDAFEGGAVLEAEDFGGGEDGKEEREEGEKNLWGRSPALWAAAKQQGAWGHRRGSRVRRFSAFRGNGDR